MKLPPTFALLAALLALVTLPAAGQAHVHGLARLDIAVEARMLTVQLEAPLDSLLGFERAPRTDAERGQTAAAIARLKAGATMFKIDPAAGCTLASVVLSSAALKLGPQEAGSASPGDGHADLDGSFEFNCADASKAAYIDVGVFGFPHLQGLQVQVATSAGQFKRDLKRPQQRIALTR